MGYPELLKNNFWIILIIKGIISGIAFLICSLILSYIWWFLISSNMCLCGIDLPVGAFLTKVIFVQLILVFWLLPLSIYLGTGTIGHQTYRKNAVFSIIYSFTYNVVVWALIKTIPLPQYFDFITHSLTETSWIYDPGPIVFIFSTIFCSGLMIITIYLNGSTDQNTSVNKYEKYFNVKDTLKVLLTITILLPMLLVLVGFGTGAIELHDHDPGHHITFAASRVDPENVVLKYEGGKDANAVDQTKPFTIMVSVKNGTGINTVCASNRSAIMENGLSLSIDPSEGLYPIPGTSVKLSGKDIEPLEEIMSANGHMNEILIIVDFRDSTRGYYTLFV